ncbi:hypothetical protein ACFY36_15285 [Actinoplanes sp. NPDC000266]
MREFSSSPEYWDDHEGGDPHEEFNSSDLVANAIPPSPLVGWPATMRPVEHSEEPAPGVDELGFIDGEPPLEVSDEPPVRGAEYARIGELEEPEESPAGLLDDRAQAEVRAEVHEASGEEPEVPDEGQEVAAEGREVPVEGREPPLEEREVPTQGPEPIEDEALERVRPDFFRELRQEADASFTAENWEREAERQREIEGQIERVGVLIDKVIALPFVQDRKELAQELKTLSGTDLRRCLEKIGDTLEALAPPRAKVVAARDPAEQIELLERSVREVEKLGSPTIVVMPAPDGRVEGRMPQREVTDVEVVKSRGVMFGADATLDIVHRCEVQSPVIEIAALIDSADNGASWEALCCEPPPGSAEGRAAAGVRPRIVDCQAVSIGDNNTQRNVFEHRISDCEVNVGVLLADHDIREALEAYRNETLSDRERAQAREQLRRIVTRVVNLTDASALIPDETLTRDASEAAARPDVRSREAGIRVMHGMGVAIGWGTTVSSRTETKIGRFQIR